jgi:hypothetical protein
MQVTREHILVIEEGEDLYLIKAEMLRLGQKLVTQDGAQLITRLEFLNQTEKYTIMTDHGTVMVNGILASTICDQNIGKEPVLFHEGIEKWRESHNNLIRMANISRK